MILEIELSERALAKLLCLSKSQSNRIIKAKDTTLLAHHLSNRFNADIKVSLLDKEGHIGGHTNNLNLLNINNKGSGKGDTQRDTREKEIKKKKKAPLQPLKEKEINKEKEMYIQSHVHTHAREVISDVKDFYLWLLDYCPFIYSHLKLITEAEFDKLKNNYTIAQIMDTCQDIENRIDLRKKYSNLYRTLLNWLKNNYGTANRRIYQGRNISYNEKRARERQERLDEAADIIARISRENKQVTT